MSKKERQRLRVIPTVLEGKMTIVDAARVLSLCQRQVIRIKARYAASGDAGLVHRSRGRRSNRAIAATVRERILKLYRERYEGFGPTLAAEKFAEEHDIQIDHETLRRLLMKASVWARQRGRPKHRRRRERRARFGELIQMDGSPHAWFEGRGSECCLIEMVDDATGTAMGRLYEGETLQGSLEVLMLWVKRYGVPMALYTDRKNIFTTDRKPTLEEQLKGEEPLTDFGKVCKKLGIEIILARSPQAKGRVERKHGVMQDRLVKELRLHRIDTLEKANALLPKFFAKLNKKFAVRPADDVDVHVPIDPGDDLDRIFAIDQERTVGNDWVVRYENRLFQIKNQKLLPLRKSKVTVARYLDGTIHIFRKDFELQHEEILERPAKPETAPPATRLHTPWTNHPWRINGPAARRTAAAEREALATTKVVNIT